MIGSSAEIQKLVFETLTGNESIMAFLGGVYDHVPAAPFASKTAYISLGPSDSHDDGSDCVIGLSTTVQIDVWSRAVGAVECKKIVDLVRRAFTDQSLALSENAFVDSKVELTRVLLDPDGTTSHGVIQITFLVEEPA